MKRPVRFALTLTEADRELADRLAARMGCSRTEAIARALHLLECVQERGTYPQIHPQVYPQGAAA